MGAQAKAAAGFDPRTEEAQLLERCRVAVERARAAGADEAEACATASQKVALRIEKGELQLVQHDEGTSLGLRALRGQRAGFASTNQTDDASLATAAEDALELAALSPADEHTGLPDPRPLPPALELARAATCALTMEEALELGRAFLVRLRAMDPRVSVDKASFSLSRASQAVGSSTGVAAAESDAAFGLSVFGMAVEGSDVGGFHAVSDVVRDADRLEAVAEALALEFTTTTLGNLGAGKAEAYHGPVLLAPAAFASILLTPLLQASSAIAVQRGRSPLAGKLGERVAAALLEVVDDPSDASLAGACRFDREGQPALRTPLVEAGVLRTHLYDAYAGRVEGRASTGHAQGGARSLPSIGSHAIVVAPGAGGERAELERALGRGLLVQRFSGTVDPTSGDFSGVAKSARWIEPGAAPRPVGEALIAGNAFELLGRLAALGSRAERLHGGSRVPWALVDGVRVTAG